MLSPSTVGPPNGGSGYLCASDGVTLKKELLEERRGRGLGVGRTAVLRREGNGQCCRCDGHAED